VRLQSGVRDAVSDADLDEAAHFAKFAFAAYGYMLYVWSKPQWKCGPRPRAPRVAHPRGSRPDAAAAAARVAALGPLAGMLRPGGRLGSGVRVAAGAMQARAPARSEAGSNTVSFSAPQTLTIRRTRGPTALTRAAGLA